MMKKQWWHDYRPVKVNKYSGVYLAKFEHKKKMLAKAKDLGIPGNWKLADKLWALEGEQRAHDEWIGRLEDRIRALENKVRGINEYLGCVEDAMANRQARETDRRHREQRQAQYDRYALEDRVSSLEDDLSRAHGGYKRW